MEVMGYQVLAIGKAIRPLFADLVKNVLQTGHCEKIQTVPFDHK